ncbi:MAG TPA: hypothetical protein DDW52_03795 [Planctomycetaceae bacterium]|nr:hypothetical protein [Planctomycetaceae bacterium]
MASFFLLAGLAAVTAAGLASTRRALGDVRRSQAATESALLERTAALSEADAQRKRAQEQGARAAEQSKRAEANLRVALDAFQEIMNNVSSRSIESDAEILGEVTDTTVADVSAADAAMLESLLEFFDELAKNNSSQLIAETSQAARYAGDIYVSLGELREASETYRRAAERLASIKAPEERLEVSLEQVRLLNQLAMVDSLRGKIDEATTAFEGAVSILEDFPELEQSAEGRFQAARAHRLYASLASRSGLDSFAQRRPGPNGRELANRPGSAFDSGGRSRDDKLPAALKSAKPFSRPQLRRLAGQSLGHLRSRQDAENAQVAIEILQELLESEPASVQYLAELAHAYRNLAEVEFRQRRRVDADRALRQSVAKWEEILTAEPDNEAAQFGLASTLASANILGFNQLYRANRAYDLTMQLVRENPTQPRYRALRARSLENLAKAELRAGKNGPAGRHAGEAVKLYRQLADQTPEVAIYAIRQVGCLDIQAEIAIAEGSPSTAKVRIASAIEAVDRALESNPQSEVCRLEKIRLTRRLQSVTGKQRE